MSLLPPLLEISVELVEFIGENKNFFGILTKNVVIVGIFGRIQNFSRNFDSDYDVGRYTPHDNVTGSIRRVRKERNPI